LPKLNEPDIDVRATLRLGSLDHTFAAFQKRKGTEKALAATRTLAEGKTDKPLFLLYGGVGNGKTHLIEALILRWWERGIVCRYLTMGEVMDSIMGSIHNEMKTVDEVCHNFSVASRMIMDDFEPFKESEWALIRLERIIDYRYRNRLPTIVSTNRDLKELPERIVSRFFDPDVSTAILNEGTDYRRRVK
jgi:DNA replication protein DnaC